MATERPELSAWELETIMGRPMAPETHRLDWFDYRREGETVWAGRYVPGPIPGPARVDLFFYATDLTRRFNHVNVRLRLELEGGVQLAWMQIDANEPRERMRLAEAAHRNVPVTMRERYTRRMLEADLDRFCFDLAPAWEWTKPAPDGSATVTSVEVPTL